MMKTMTRIGLDWIADEDDDDDHNDDGVGQAVMM
jgi:hypothetical protein